MAEILIFKVFGYTENEILKNLEQIVDRANVRIHCEALDAKIEIECDKGKASEIQNAVYQVFYGAVYAEEDVSLAKAVLDRLSLYGKTLSVAESLTGGLVTSRIVSIPGASEVLIEGLVTYSNEAKIKRLKVDESAIRAFGAVSEEVARQMAKGLILSGSDFAVSTTGIAGPGGGSKEKPVGLTYIGVADEINVWVTKCLFSGDREEIRNEAANTALFLLWKKLVKPNDFENMVIE